MPGISKPQICGLGQPLLDITATVGEGNFPNFVNFPNFADLPKFVFYRKISGFLNRHGLESNGSIVGTGSEHEAIFEEIVNYFPVAISPGGQTLNTMRCVKVTVRPFCGISCS